MQGTAHIDQFSEDPVGRYLIAPTWIHWCAHPGLFGVTLWGRPGEDDIQALVRSLKVELQPHVAAHQSLVDARRVQSANLEAFNLLSSYVQHHHGELAQQVVRLALVRPDGLAGAVAAGFYEVLDSPYPVSIFDSAADALAWLEPDGESSFLEEITRARLAMTGVPPMLETLRLMMVAQHGRIDVHAAAKALGLSERSLQRHLKSAGTTFGEQLGAARIGEAKRRMLESDEPLTRIALDVGFPSLANFSAHFRKAEGEAPSTWRSTKRGR